MTPTLRTDLRALWIGLLAGVTGILCCASPVVLFLFGVASASEAISLGDHLYNNYAWYFRAAGMAVGIVATLVYLRRRNRCSIAGARAEWRTLLSVIATAVATYIVLFITTDLLAAAGSRR